MAWQPHNSNNEDRATSPYIDRNVTNDAIGDLNTENAYVRNDEANAVDDPQPGYESASDDFTNQFKNWNADYIKRDQNGDDLNPDIPIVGQTETQTIGVTADATRVQETVTGVLATFSGGTAPLVIEGAFYCKPTGTTNRDTLSDWTECSTPSTADNQTYVPQPSDVGMEIAFVTRVTDGKGVTATSIGDILTVYSIHSVTNQTSYSGVKKVGQTLDIYVATAEGGIPELNYLVQLRFSDTGSTGWGDNVTLKANATPGEKIEYLIPSEKAGKYVQIRTRTRDANGINNQEYNQIWSIAPDSSLQISDYLDSTGQNELSGEFRMQQTVTVSSIADFTGGAPAVTYEYQWQKSDNGVSDWTGFDSAFIEFDPNTVLDNAPVKVLDSGVILGKYVRLQTRATDRVGEVEMGQGAVYGPVTPEEPVVFLPTAVIAPLDLIDGAYMVDDTIRVGNAAQFVGGALPYISKEVRIMASHDELLASFSDPDGRTDMEYRITYQHVGDFFSVKTIVVDAEGHETEDEQFLYNPENGNGAILNYEPGLELISPTETYGYATPGNTIRIRCAEYSGGIDPQSYQVLYRVSDTLGGPHQQFTIESNATPGEFYDLPITFDHLNKYLTILTRVADNNRNLEDGFVQKFNIIEFEYQVIVPSTPTPSGPAYDYNGYNSKLYVEPNYKQGNILRVGDTITMTVPEFFGGEAPYRYDLSYWRIFAKKDGTSDTVFQSPLNQPPGSTQTFTIPQSLQGNYLKVNYYLYDRLLNITKNESKLYSGDNPESGTGLIMPAL